MKLTEENYYTQDANNEYMSVSQFKSFKKCEYAALEELKGNYQREYTTSLLVGSYCDSFFDESLPDFTSAHPELFKRDGSLKADYIKAEEIIERIKKDKLFMEYMSGEKQVIMTGEISGVPVKIKMDSYHPGKMIVDLKIMKDFMPIYKPEEGRLNFIHAWGYDIQGAVYQEIVRQNTGDKLPFYIAGATKEKEPDLDIFEVPQGVLDAALYIFENDVTQYQAIKKGFIEPERCGKCDCCRQTKVIKRPKTWEELNEYGN